MNRLAIAAFQLLMALATAGAQESESTTEAAAEEAAETADEDAADSALDDVTDEEIEELLGLDEDYDESDDGFDPTVEIRAEDAIVFPVDI